MVFLRGTQDSPCLPSLVLYIYAAESAKSLPPARPRGVCRPHFCRPFLKPILPRNFKLCRILLARAVGTPLKLRVGSAAALSEPRAPMEALAALLSERPQQQLSATELRSRIALGCSRTPQGPTAPSWRASRGWMPCLTRSSKSSSASYATRSIPGPPWPTAARASASKGLREPMQRVGFVGSVPGLVTLLA